MKKTEKKLSVSSGIRTHTHLGETSNVIASLRIVTTVPYLVVRNQDTDFLKTLLSSIEYKHFHNLLVNAARRKKYGNKKGKKNKKKKKKNYDNDDEDNNNNGGGSTKK